MYQYNENHKNQTLVINSLETKAEIDLLTDNPELSTLQLGTKEKSIYVYPESARIILNFLRNTRTLSHLTINLDSHVKTETIALMGQAIEENTSLIAVYISLCTLQEKSIMDAIIKNQSITSIIIAGKSQFSTISENRSQYIASTLSRLIGEKKNIKKLELFEISSKLSCENIATALAANTSLLELALPEIELDNRQMTLITDALILNKHLKKLTTRTQVLQMNRQAVIDALRQNTSLIEFNCCFPNPFGVYTHYKNDFQRPLNAILARNRLITPAYIWMMLKIGMADNGSLLYGNILPELINNICRMLVINTKPQEDLTNIMHDETAEMTRVDRLEFSIMEPAKPYPDSFWKPCHTISNALRIQLQIKKIFAMEVYQVRFNWQTDLNFACDDIIDPAFVERLGACNASRHYSPRSKKYMIRIQTKENIVKFFDALSLNREQCPNLYINYPLETKALDNQEKCSLQ